MTRQQQSSSSTSLPRFVAHGSFSESNAKRQYDPTQAVDATAYADKFMPDDITRDYAKRMHYAAYRMAQAQTTREQAKWRDHYLQLRDQIVLGNRKLVYRAVRRRMALAHRADDLIGECHIVLIQAVAAYNPWMGIRFSTYAFTCLVRALSRLSQRLSSDWLSRSLPLELVAEEGPDDKRSGSADLRLDEFLRDDHPLLSSREKMIIARRFRFQETTGGHTLEKVGLSMGLSKERVRQVQASALGKLRRALLEGTKS